MHHIVSEQGPLYSIHEALQQAQDGDTIVLQHTQYDEFFSISKSVTIKGNGTTCTGGFKVEHTANVTIENITFSNVPRIDCYGHTTLKYVHIAEPRDAITLFAGSCQLTLFHCQLTTTNARDQGIQIKNGNARIESTFIKGPFHVGCFVNHSEILLLATYFEQNFKGVQFERESVGEVNECSFNDHEGTQCVVMSNSNVRFKNTRWQNGNVHAISAIEQSNIHLLHCEFTGHNDYQIYVRESTAAFESCHLEKAKSGMLFEKNSKGKLLYVTCEQHENLQVKSIGTNDLHLAQCVFKETNGNSLSVKEKGKVIVERTLFTASKNPKFPQLYVEDSIVDLNECMFKHGASSAVYCEQHSLLTLRNCEFIQHQHIQLHSRQSKVYVFNCAFTQCNETSVFYEFQSEGVVDTCHFGRSYNSQLAFNGESQASVRNSTFTQAGTNAIYISKSNVQLEHIDIRDHIAKHPAIVIEASIVGLHHISATNIQSETIHIHAHSTIIGSNISIEQGTSSHIAIHNSTAQLTHLQLADGKSYGLYMKKSDVSVSHSELRNHDDSGIYMLDGEATLQYTNIFGHTRAFEQQHGTLYAEGLQFVKNDTQWQSNDASTFIKHSQFRGGKTGLQFINGDVHLKNVHLTEHEQTQLSLDNCKTILTDTAIHSGYGDGLHARYCPLVQLQHTTIDRHDGENIITIDTTLTEQ
ncbi:MAG: right-handed parallel beta-helix repeat-containing protein [Caryophanon sp.]|nr:right-handed parallel beta-helix repeat-containing protein [Caryophanon sp.]